MPVYRNLLNYFIGQWTFVLVYFLTGSISMGLFVVIMFGVLKELYHWHKKMAYTPNLLNYSATVAGAIVPYVLIRGA